MEPASGFKQSEKSFLSEEYDNFQDEGFKDANGSQVLFVVPLDDLRLIAITSAGGFYITSFRFKDRKPRTK